MISLLTSGTFELWVRTNVLLTPSQESLLVSTGRVLLESSVGIIYRRFDGRMYFNFNSDKI